MPRSGREARERLEKAALALFAERGFDAVTTAEIAERAGVTERTFFRHFPDKREVLFDGERRLSQWVIDAMQAVPVDVPAWKALRRAVDAVVPPLEANRAESDRLGQIIAVTPALWERGAAKEAHLVVLVAELLLARGVADDEADLLARVGWGALAHAMKTWRADSPDAALQPHVDRAFARLSRLTDAAVTR
ncbi:TetR/AcrR family transcriptional regulator [Frondihabitans australicus]|uniref:TetR family transcriptional regulator n=1 Tax=Frondihabitans australicus TaxID=386892 RepID=A0A495IIY9_9MICO|nr:TetR family transcriptional regulator [Frondihabitans australicus]RKR75964.1 TetR family transcriptional regulator [Frondihabitans australicus]